MQTPYITISTMNNRAKDMLLKILSDKKKGMRAQLLKKYQDDMYDYEDNQIEQVLESKSEDYYHIGILINKIEESTAL